jgi:hypothetical protein
MTDLVDAQPGDLETVNFIEYLKHLPWCRQESGTLVAVYKLTSEVIEVVRESEVKIYPGGMVVKLPRSVLMGLQKSSDDGQPLPAVLVWKTEGVEIWFRRQKSTDFPYDTWTDPGALGIEREKGFVTNEKLGADAAAAFAEMSGKAKECPAMIPPY